MLDSEVDKELAVVKRWTRYIVGLIVAAVSGLAILTGCPTAVCLHQDCQRVQLGEAKWSTERPPAPR